MNVTWRASWAAAECVISLRSRADKAGPLESNDAARCSHDLSQVRRGGRGKRLFTRLLSQSALAAPRPNSSAALSLLLEKGMCCMLLFIYSHFICQVQSITVPGEKATFTVQS